MADLRLRLAEILAAHLPDAKDYARGVKVCTCGHEVLIGDMDARQQHLIDVLVDGLTWRDAIIVPLVEPDSDGESIDPATRFTTFADGTVVATAGSPLNTSVHSQGRIHSVAGIREYAAALLSAAAWAERHAAEHELSPAPSGSATGRVRPPFLQPAPYRHANGTPCYGCQSCLDTHTDEAVST